MDGKKILGIVLLLAGVAGGFYGLLSYTGETHGSQLGNLFSVAGQKGPGLPAWAGPPGQAAPAASGSPQRP
jgi:hypothetical protein